jgi:hypothetical protein
MVHHWSHGSRINGFKWSNGVLQPMMMHSYDKPTDKHGNLSMIHSMHTTLPKLTNHGPANTNTVKGQAVQTHNMYEK